MQGIEAVWQKAEKVFGDRIKASVWLTAPRHLLAGMTAIEFVKDQQSLATVMKLLAQIEHGYAC